MRINGTLFAPIAGVTQNVSGYVGISPNGYFANNTPRAMLHLDGLNNTGNPGFPGDWRSWMKTGVYIRENSDAMYVGLKDEFATAGINRSDAVISWSDDPTVGGPDKLRFLFTSTSTGLGTGSDPRNGTSYSGYQMMCMQPFPAITNGAGFPVGHVGIGPMFSNTQFPQNRLHMNAEDNLANFLQISNQNGTGATGTDGLQIGYPTTAPTFLTAHINQHENDNMVMLTNNGERLRLSQIGNISIPNMNPAGIANNITRVSISRDPASPVTRPLSLLHLGYNTGLVSTTANSTDGWRPWMDIGTFASNGTDHVYIGLKDEGGNVVSDRQDAVLCWGDNQINSGLPPNNGPDNFRFIFTSTTSGSAGGTNPAISANGLEGMRLTPTTANGVYAGVGGAPGFNAYSGGTQNPNNTLEVNSWGAATTPGGSSGLRFTDLTAATPTITNPGSGVLSVNANGDVIYVPGGPSGANNGLSINGGIAQLGGLCSNPAQVTASQLTASRALDLNGFIFEFRNGRTGFGTSACTPGNRVEIAGLGASPSGLRFSNLNSGSAISAPNGKVLSVDGNGDVILVPDQSGSNVPGLLGNSCGISATNPLASNWEIPMAGHSFVFSNQNNLAGCNVSIGDYNCSPTDKLEVVGKQVDGQTAISVKNNNTGSATTFAGMLLSDIPSGSQASLKKFSASYVDPTIGSSPGMLDVFNSGSIFMHTRNSGDLIRISANNGPVELGNVNINNVSNLLAATGTFPSAAVRGNMLLESDPGFPTSLQINSGTTPISYLGISNNGGAVYLYDLASPATYAIRMLAGNGGAPLVNIGTTANNGMLNVGGTVYANGSTLTSDSTLKTNIQALDFAWASQKIKALRPVSYEWITKHDTLMYGTKYGFTAQQVETVVPDLVHTDSAGKKTLDYNGIISLLTKALQSEIKKNDKQDSLISAMQQQLASLAGNLDQCCSNNQAARTASNSAETKRDVELSDKDVVVLNQNVPNPFAESTYITYNIPDSFKFAQIIFSTTDGKIIKAVDVKETGRGRINVFASDLSSGLYTYSLIIDGRVIDTKKMVKQD